MRVKVVKGRSVLTDRECATAQILWKGFDQWRNEPSLQRREKARTTLKAVSPERLPGALRDLHHPPSSVPLQAAAPARKLDAQTEFRDDSHARGTSNTESVASTPTVLVESKPNAADGSEEGKTLSARFSLQSTPPWIITLFFEVLASDSREFEVKVSHKYVYFRGKTTPTAPHKWREALGSLVQHCLLQVARREHNFKDKQPQGKEYPLVAEFFSYRITDAGLRQADDWARQVNKRSLKRKS